MEYTNSCSCQLPNETETMGDGTDTMGSVVESIVHQASRIGKHVELWNKDDIPLALTETTGEQNSEGYYDSRVPTTVKIVAYALGINYLTIQEDYNGIEWYFNGYHNIIFDEQGRQIGHMIYPVNHSSKGKVVLYKDPIPPQLTVYEDD